MIWTLPEVKYFLCSILIYRYPEEHKRVVAPELVGMDDTSSSYRSHCEIQEDLCISQNFDLYDTISFENAECGHLVKGSSPLLRRAVLLVAAYCFRQLSACLPTSGICISLHGIVEICTHISVETGCHLPSFSSRNMYTYFRRTGLSFNVIQ